MLRSLVGSEMCIRDRHCLHLHRGDLRRALRSGETDGAAGIHPGPDPDPHGHDGLEGVGLYGPARAWKVHLGGGKETARDV